MGVFVYVFACFVCDVLCVFGCACVCVCFFACVMVCLCVVCVLHVEVLFVD